MESIAKHIDLGPVVAEQRIFPIACPNIMV